MVARRHAHGVQSSSRTPASVAVAAYAPVTKGLLMSSIGASIISQAARASHRPLPYPLTAAAHCLVFRTPGELLFGSLLLYYFR